jgi:hypothetical protein
MNGRSDATDPLGKDPGIARVPSWQNEFDSPEHHAGAPDIRNPATIDLNLDTQVPFDTGNRIYRDPLLRPGCSGTASLHKRQEYLVGLWGWW